MKYRVLILVLFGALLLIFSHVPCHAGAPTEKVRGMLAQVMSIQTDPKLKNDRDKRRDAIKKIILQNFDFNTMAKTSLGSHWNKLSGAQRSEFKKIFQNLFQDSYTRLVLDFLSREEVHYDQELPQKGQVIVKTSIRRTNDQIPVDYTLSSKGDLLIQDVDIDGVSIVKNYQRSFSRVIKRGSYNDLVKKMRMQQKVIK